MFKQLALIALGLSAAVPSYGETAYPLPILQLDYPVLEVGEVGFITVQVPPYAGPSGSQSYAFYMKRQNDEYDPGYRLLFAQCPRGFSPRYYNSTEAECYRIKGGPHPAFEMVLEIENVGAVDGETYLPTAMISSIDGVGRIAAPLRLYGVR